MKIIIFLLVITGARQAFAQNLGKERIVSDKPFKVTYDQTKNNKLPAFFINGRLSSQTLTINPNDIGNITVD